MSSPYDQVILAETYSLILTKLVRYCQRKPLSGIILWTSAHFRPLVVNDYTVRRGRSAFEWKLVRLSWFLECGMM